ncbi:hypothetical protein [Mycolicibacterium sp. XJ1819]
MAVVVVTVGVGAGELVVSGSVVGDEGSSVHAADVAAKATRPQAPIDSISKRLARGFWVMPQR